MPDAAPHLTVTAPADALAQRHLAGHRALDEQRQAGARARGDRVLEVFLESHKYRGSELRILHLELLFSHPQRTIAGAGRPQDLVARVVRLRIVLAAGRRQPLVVRPAQTQEQHGSGNAKHHDRPEDRSHPLQNVRGRFQLGDVVYKKKN